MWQCHSGDRNDLEPQWHEPWRGNVDVSIKGSSMSRAKLAVRRSCDFCLSEKGQVE